MSRRRPVKVDFKFRNMKKSAGGTSADLDGSGTLVLAKTAITCRGMWEVPPSRGRISHHCLLKLLYPYILINGVQKVSSSSEHISFLSEKTVNNSSASSCHRYSHIFLTTYYIIEMLKHEKDVKKHERYKLETFSAHCSDRQISVHLPRKYVVNLYITQVVFWGWWKPSSRGFFSQTAPCLETNVPVKTVWQGHSFVPEYFLNHFKHKHKQFHAHTLL